MQVKRDAVGLWFSVLGEKESIDILFGSQRRSDKIQWELLPHSQFDGVGGLAHLLRKKGHRLVDLPKLKNPTNPGLLKISLLAARYLATMAFYSKPVRLRRAKNFGKRNGPTEVSVATAIFDEDQTGVLLSKARRDGITLNTLLLSTLGEVVRPHMTFPEGTISWMIPVNMRGGVTQKRDTANHASFIEVDVKEKDKALETHGKILTALDRSFHWLYWSFFNVSAALGPRLMKGFLEFQEKTKKRWTGAFSNLGAWKLEGETSDWYFCPPVLRQQPLGAGCVTVNGRLTLTVQIHPSALRSTDLAQVIVEAWVKKLDPRVWQKGFVEPFREI